MASALEWLYGQPIWVQAPLVVLVVLLGCAAIVALWMKAMQLLVPPSEEERYFLGQGQAQGEMQGQAQDEMQSKKQGEEE